MSMESFTDGDMTDIAKGIAAAAYAEGYDAGKLAASIAAAIPEAPRVPDDAKQIEQTIIRIGARCSSSKHDGVHSALACWNCGGSNVDPKRAKQLRELLTELRAAAPSAGGMEAERPMKLMLAAVEGFQAGEALAFERVADLLEDARKALTLVRPPTPESDNPLYYPLLFLVKAIEAGTYDMLDTLDPVRAAQPEKPETGR